MPGREREDSLNQERTQDKLELARSFTPEERAWIAQNPELMATMLDRTFGIGQLRFLKVLAEKAGEVVSRDEIMEALSMYEVPNSQLHNILTAFRKAGITVSFEQSKGILGRPAYDNFRLDPQESQ